MTLGRENVTFSITIDHHDVMTLCLCYNYFMVIATGTLGMTPVTSLGLVSNGWRKAYQNAMGVCDRNREEPLNDS